jgi:transposase-like protein
MPYLLLNRRPHECSLPTSIHRHRGSVRIAIGSVWACPLCKQQWMVENVTDVSQANFDGQTLYWRKMVESEFLPNL